MALGSSLSNLLRNADFKLVDIGARGGSMEELAILAPFSHYYACEPDPEEAQNLTDKLKNENKWREVTIVPEAISSKEGETNLYITKHAGLSSLLKPNDAIIKRFYADPVFQIESSVNIPAISLNHASDRYGFQDACFLKIDTQGTELDILKSGRQFVEEHVLAVYIEVEFHPFYTEQPLFSDVDSYLRSLSFSLFDLTRVLMRRASHQSKLYSRRKVVWAHALYFKEPDIILLGDDDRTLRNVMRLLGLALAFEHFDLALELVTSACSSMLISNAYDSQIKKDVEDFIRGRTADLLDEGDVDESLPNCTTSMYKDKKNVLRHQHYQTLRERLTLERKLEKYYNKYNELNKRHQELNQLKTVALEKMIRKFCGKLRPNRK